MIYDDYLSIRATKFAWMGARVPQRKERGRPIEEESLELNEMCLKCTVPPEKCFGECRTIEEAEAKQAGIVLRKRGRKPKPKRVRQYKSTLGASDPCLKCRSAAICKETHGTCSFRLRWERDNGVS